MTQNCRKLDGGRLPVLAVATIVTMAGLLGLTGCTGTDTLDQGIVQLEFLLSSSDPSTIDWSCIQLDLVSLTVTTLDGNCSAASAVPDIPCHGDSDCPGGACDGNLSQEILPQAIALPVPDGKLGFQDGECPPQLSLVGVPPGFFNPVTTEPSALTLPSLILSSGLYRIESIQFGDALLASTDETGTTTCDVLASATSGILECYGQCGGTALADYGDDLIFRVGEGGIRGIQLTLDISELENRVGFPPPACDVSNPNDLLNIQFIQ